VERYGWLGSIRLFSVPSYYRSNVPRVIYLYTLRVSLIFVTQVRNNHKTCL